MDACAIMRNLLQYILLQVLLYVLVWKYYTRRVMTVVRCAHEIYLN